MVRPVAPLLLFGAMHPCTSLVQVPPGHFSPTQQACTQHRRGPPCEFHPTTTGTSQDVCTRITNCTRCARSTDDDHHYCTGQALPPDPIVQSPGANFQDGMDKRAPAMAPPPPMRPVASPTSPTSTPEGLLKSLRPSARVHYPWLLLALAGSQFLAAVEGNQSQALSVAAAVTATVLLVGFGMAAASSAWARLQRWRRDPRRSAEGWARSLSKAAAGLEARRAGALLHARHRSGAYWVARFVYL
jgi:hypothetical protein